MKELKIIGIELDQSKDTILPPLEDEEFELVQAIKVSKSRAAGEVIKLKIEEEDDIIDALFEDGTEWIGSAHDFEEIFTDQEIQITRGGEPGLLPSGIMDDSNRGLGSFFRAINIFRKKDKLPNLAGRKLGEWLDQKLAPNPGVYRLTRQFELKPYNIDGNATKKFFVFIHGTISNTENSFHKLKEFDSTGAWDLIHDRFGDNVLALEHYTISESPLKNALDLLEALPKDSEINLMSGSRGGLIGDILAKCDHRNEQPGFSKNQIESLEGIDPEEAELARQLNKLIKKKITVHKNIRVACPGAGTKILDKRADHFLNAILRVIGLAFKPTPIAPIYKFVRRFIMKVIKSRTTPGVMPGLLAMIPRSHIIQLLNHPLNRSEDNLYVIEGNSRFGKFGQTILVILTRIYFLKKNDFVVNTDSMRLGVRRRKGSYWFRTEDGQTHHLNYFKNNPSQKAIKLALESERGTAPTIFSHYGIEVDRGPVAKLFNLVEENRQDISGNKPIVVLLPGIMGSHLYSQKEHIWVDFDSIIRGKIVSNLNMESDVEATSLVGNFYSSLVDELEKTYDVYCFPYDWRKSLEESAQELKAVLVRLSSFGEELKIVAHSMGGVVVRALMMKDPSFWQQYIQQEESRLIMLGTPWYGSYLILEVLTGKSNRVAQLAFLDFVHSRNELVETLLQYPGIFELLPIEEARSFESPDFWRDLKSEFPDIIEPDPKLLERFMQVKKAVSKTNFDFRNTYYIAGKSSRTTFDYRSTRSIFSTQNEIQFLKTPYGDGSVTWEGGIPGEFPPGNLYYTETTHGQLANDPTLFDGIRELLSHGKTSKFSQIPPKIRSNESIVAEAPETVISNEPKDLLDFLYGVPPMDQIEKSTVEIEITVSLGHLRHAWFPVMAGHFDQDGIVSAEAALDWHLDSKLKERHELGIYPGKLKESEIVLQKSNKPPGALIIGLGDIAQLTAFQLSETVEAGILKYAMFTRDHYNQDLTGPIKSGITSVLIGSGFGRLPIRESLTAIIRGVDRANRIIVNRLSELTPITKLEFIEIFEHNCRQAFYALKDIIRTETKLSLTLVKNIEQKRGSHKKLEYNMDEAWWDQISVNAKENKKNRKVLEFTLSTGLARIQSTKLFPSEALVENLLKDFAPNTMWIPKRAKTLFETLIPRDFKSVIRNQHNIVWKVDKITANYPWEMFHDYKTDDEPAFVNSGMIRQLITEDYRPKPRIIRDNKALVIGDPLYTDMPDFQQLEGALQESKQVYELLDQNGFRVDYLKRSEGTTILDSLSDSDYKILHMAGHGVYDIENHHIGPVLGNGMYLDSSILRNLDNVPEFVFINCCHSGEVGPELATKDRYKLAANIGTTFIEMGVQAIIVAGWAVNDQAAKVFAEEFYRSMLNGNYFGDAVKKARKQCFVDYPSNNTWGAFQCYGNQWYTLNSRTDQSADDKEYIAYEEVEVDLFNLKSRSEDQKRSSKVFLKKRLLSIMDKAYRSNMINGGILEIEADIYSILDEVDIAVDKYQALLSLDQSDYSVRVLENYGINRIKKLFTDPALDNNKIEECLGEVKSLSLIKKTPERMRILGYAYKLFSVYVQGGRIGYLQEMFQQFVHVYKMTQNQIFNNYSALCEILTAHILLGKQSTGRLLNQDLDSDKLLKSAFNHLQAERGNLTQFKYLLLKVRLQTVEFLLAEENQEQIQLSKKIIKGYNQVWAYGGSPMSLKNEIEHFQFLTRIPSRKISKAIRDALKLILRSLEEIIH